MMSNAESQVTVDTLQAFADAWNRHDVDALMTFMTDDGAIALKNSYRKNR